VKRVWDVTQVVAPGLWVWPGDKAYDCAWTWRMRDGATCNVGQIALSCHAGTHIDAPYHFAETGATVEKAPLQACIGPCVVVQLAQLAEARGEERVLVKAAGGTPSLEQIEGLAGLRLFGTDGPSVDPMDSRTLDAHHLLWHKGAVILEGLDLGAVPDGRYELIALPLRLAGMDAAPVRAVLREL